MSKLTPAEFQEKHARRLKAAAPDIRKGIERITVSPTAQAADKQEKMRQHLVESIDNGTWARRLRGVSLEEWRDKAINVGVGRIASGIDSAKAKVTTFAEQLLPAVDAAQAKVKAMPDLTLDDSISRMTTFITEMSKFKKK